jgi:SNF2 family DNA or RNA helicase
MAGERLEWSDDDGEPEAVYNNFKKRRATAQKQNRESIKRARTTATSMVGRKARRALPAVKRLAEDDEDTALLEATLPKYLQQRRRSWAELRSRDGLDTLLVPPYYDDIYFSDDEHLADLRERPKLDLVPPKPYQDIELKLSAGTIPAPLAQYLKPYQVQGAQWLHRKFVYQEGGILGDDMGLGKTIQVIAFLTAAFGKTGDERDNKRMRKVRRMADDRWYPRIIIICPGGLMQNWKNELDRWGWWHVDVMHGANKLDILAAAEHGRLEIVITTYQTYRLNESAINGTRWDCVIADECHIIKERGSAITKSMNNINALCRLGLSGTAIQNNYEELWTLLNWANPGVLGPISVWKETICLPLKMGQSHDATVAQLSKARRIATKLVDNLLPRFFLRRNKTLIADQLPKKSDRVVFCPLTEIQTDAYNNFVDHPLVHAIRDSAQPCDCQSGLKRGNCCGKVVEGYGKWQTWVFPCLMTIQRLANHVALLVPSAEADLDKHEKDLERLKIALPEMWKELYEQRDSLINYANINFCGKWTVLKKLLRLWYSNGDKVLVFSHSVRLLRMLQMLFKSTTSYNVSYLDGSLSYEERQKAVDEYNSDPAQFVFLISTKAGGVGLNITSANKVVVVDPNWNPSYDLQAQDRAYRIGQTRDVDVFRLVSAGTVEEIVYARQIYKQQQANIGYTASVERRYFKGVQDQKDMKGEIFGLANIFAPQSENVVLREIVNNTNIAETRAGVEIRGLDMEASRGDDDDDDADIDGNPLLGDDRRADAAMSQLAAEIIDAPAGRRTAALAAAAKKKKDPVQAILASANVQYTHENSEVIGTSKIETRISRRAQRTGDDAAYIDRTAFLNSQSQQALLPTGVMPGALGEPHGAGNTPGMTPLDADGRIKYRYRPPEDVRCRQFCTMAARLGFEDDVPGFALVVEGMTQQQRRDFLDTFYAEREVMLKGE